MLRCAFRGRWKVGCQWAAARFTGIRHGLIATEGYISKRTMESLLFLVVNASNGNRLRLQSVPRNGSRGVKPNLVEEWVKSHFSLRAFGPFMEK